MLIYFLICCGQVQEYQDSGDGICKIPTVDITVNRQENCNAIGWGLNVTEWGDETQNGNNDCRTIRYAFYLNGNYEFHVEGTPNQIVIANDLGFGAQTGQGIPNGESSTYLDVEYHTYRDLISFLADNTQHSFDEWEGGNVTMTTIITNCCGAEWRLDEIPLTKCEEVILAACDGSDLVACDGSILVF